jgi:TPR repeat protein
MRRTLYSALAAAAVTVASSFSADAFAQLAPTRPLETEVAPVTVTGKRPPKAWRPAPNPIPVELGADTEMCWQAANDPYVASVPGLRIYLPTRYPRNPDYSAPPKTPPGSPFPAVLSMKEYIRGKPGDPDRNLALRGKLSDCLHITQGAPSMAQQMEAMAARVLGGGGNGELSMGVMRADGFDYNPNGRAEIRGRDKTLPLAFALFDHGRYEEALEQFKRADRKVYSLESPLMIGKIYLFGLRDKSDPVEGVKWLKKLAGEGFESATMTPQFDPREPDKITPLGEAALILADLYGRGHGPIARDPVRARGYLETAYRVGHIDAANTLGDIYYYGVDVEPDRARAFDYYMKAAKFGHAPAAVAVARMYEAGEVGAGPDHAKALAWYAVAARIEHPQALYALAVAYGRGEGVPANPKGALLLYKAAAIQGDPAAQAAIGTYFYRGEGDLPRDHTLARKWFELAAVGGDAEGMFNLAAMQAKGEGGEVDRVRAWGWLKIAERVGHSNAAVAIRGLEAQFTPDEWAGVGDLTERKAGKASE